MVLVSIFGGRRRLSTSVFVFFFSFSSTGHFLTRILSIISSLTSSFKSGHARAYSLSRASSVCEQKCPYISVADGRLFRLHYTWLCVYCASEFWWRQGDPLWFLFWVICCVLQYDISDGLPKFGCMSHKNHPTHDKLYYCLIIECVHEESCVLFIPWGKCREFWGEVHRLSASLRGF